MGQPLVSVIVPTFNRAGWVVEAVQSVLDQTYEAIELIVVDDGSQDDTLEVLKGFGPGLIVLQHSHAGVSAARNHGAAASRGELLAFLDSDDLWRVNKVAMQVELLQQQPLSRACYTDEIWIRNGVRVNPRLIHRKYDGWMFFQALPRCIISPSSIMMRRDLWEALGGFDERLPACEDYDLWLRLTVREPVRLVTQKLIVKRGGHHDQLSRTVSVLDQYRIAALEKIVRTTLTLPQRRAVLETLAQKCTIVAQGAQKRQHEARRVHYHTKAEHYTQLTRFTS